VEESTGQSSLFKNSTLGIAITNSTFRFLTANPAFLKMLGYSSEELQQQSFLDICTDEDRDECRVALRELREGARLQYETEIRRHAGMERYCPSIRTFQPPARVHLHS
jgi:PAS domain S-box-containing protein